MAECSDRTERKLRKKRQGRKRALRRAQALPRSEMRSRLIRRRRTQLREASERLAACRRAQIPRVQRLALELATHRWSRFAYSSPTGGTAKVALMELYADGDARCAATGRTVKGSADTERLLLMLVDLCDIAKGLVYINTILSGIHRRDSTHYEFRAGDVGTESAVTSAEVRRVCQRHGVSYLDESATAHWHLCAGANCP